MSMKKQILIGSVLFSLPFRVNGYWVEDSLGKNYCECVNAYVAKFTAEMLNEKHL